MNTLIGRTIAYSDIFDIWPTIEKLDSILLRYSRIDLLRWIAWLISEIEGWKRTTSNATDLKLRALLIPKLLPKFPTAEDRFVFSKHSLLWLMQRVFVVCPNDNVSRASGVPEAFGLACLIANDLSTYTVARSLSSDLELAANMMALADNHPQEDFKRDIPRVRYILSDVAPRSDRRDLRAVPVVLEQSLGRSPKEHASLALATAIKSIVLEPTEKVLPPLISATSFGTTAIEPKRAEDFLKSISADGQWFHDECSKSGYVDFTPFRRRPLLRLDNGTYLVLDAGFVFDKAGRGLFWDAIGTLETRERQQQLGLWGELFDRYVSDLLADVTHSKRSVIANPRFADGDEAMDCCVMEGSTLIAIEAKASTLRASVRYADDPELLREELEKRFVKGDGSGAKGLSQIKNFLVRFSSGETLYDSKMTDIASRRTVHKIIPVLVHLDTALRTPRINHYMADQFKQLVRITRPIVTPLVVSSIAEIEELQGFLEDLPLSEILESYLGRLNSDRTTVFLARGIPLLQGRCERGGLARVRLEKIYQETVDGLFPGRGAPLTPDYRECGGYIRD